MLSLLGSLLAPLGYVILPIRASCFGKRSVTFFFVERPYPAPPYLCPSYSFY
jgi:hypothetical protein